MFSYPILLVTLTLSTYQRKSSPTAREHSPSAQSDMDVSSSSDEDGLIPRFEQEEDRDRRLYGRPSSSDDALNISDLERVRLSRKDVVGASIKPWFEDYVKGPRSSVVHRKLC
jgi:RNA polymerase-associated protein RTF1